MQNFAPGQISSPTVDDEAKPDKNNSIIFLLLKVNWGSIIDR